MIRDDLILDTLEQNTGVGAVWASKLSSYRNYVVMFYTKEKSENGSTECTIQL